MNNELVINSTPSEVTIALLEDKNLVELNSEKRDQRFSVGDIYLGRVKKLIPGLNAAFVDVGHEKDAFLHYLDLGPQAQSLAKLIRLTTTGKKPDPMVLGKTYLKKNIFPLAHSSPPIALTKLCGVRNFWKRPRENH